MNTKRCAKCVQYLPLKMFYTRTHSYCKSCYRVWRQEWRKTPAGRASEQRTQAKYKASEQVRAQKAEYNNHYKAKNAGKMKAYSRVYNQSEAGKGRNRRYHQSEKGKAAERRFRQSAKRQAYLAQLKASGKLAEYRRRFDQTEKGKASRHRINTSEKGRERDSIAMHGPRKAGQPTQGKCVVTANHRILGRKRWREGTFIVSQPNIRRMC